MENNIDEIVREFREDYAQFWDGDDGLYKDFENFLREKLASIEKAAKEEGRAEMVVDSNGFIETATLPTRMVELIKSHAVEDFRASKEFKEMEEKAWKYDQLK